VGRERPYCRPACGQAYAAAIEGARFEVMPGTGHVPQMETPDLVRQAIADWGKARERGS
jgi:pimeloyl-ACP methyl ester carboxylesterase